MERTLYFTNIHTKAFIKNSNRLITENQQDRVNDAIEVRKICKVSIGKIYRECYSYEKRIREIA